MTERNSLEEFIEHHVIYVSWAGAVELNDSFGVGIVTVKCTELTASISKKNQEVLCLAASDLLEDFLFSIAINHAWEDAIFHRVQ